MAFFQYSGTRGRDLLELDGDRLSIGKSSGSDVIIDDPAVSRFHAVVEHIGGGWCLRDLGSTNGTLVNGKRLSGEQLLRDGDEVVLGRTRLVYRDRAASDDTSTTRLARAPSLTPREHDVLVELCRPALNGGAFTAPASVRDIAGVLVVTEAAVKQHLTRLFDKFDIPEEGRDPRRVRLANQAMQSGAVTLGDLKTRSSV